MYIQILKNSISLIKRGLSAVVIRDLFAISVKVGITLLSAKHLSSKDFASFLLLSMVAGYVEVLFRFKTDVSLGYFIGKKKFNQNDILDAQNSLILVAIIFTFIFLSLLSHPLLNYLKIDTQFTIFVIGYLSIYCAGMQIFGAFVYLHLFYENFKLYRQMTLINSFIYLLGVLIFTDQLSIFHILGSQLLGLFTAILYSFYKSEYVPKIRFSRDISMIKSLIKHSGKLYILSVVSILQLNLMLTLAGTFLSSSAVGHFGILRQVFQLVERVPDFFNLIFYGTIMRNNKNNKHLTILLSAAVGIICSIILLLIYLSLNQINLLLFSGKFLYLTKYFILLAPSILLMCLVSPLIQFLNSENYIMLSVKNLTVALTLSLFIGFMVKEETNEYWLSLIYIIQASTMFVLTVWDFYKVKSEIK